MQLSSGITMKKFLQCEIYVQWVFGRVNAIFELATQKKYIQAMLENHEKRQKVFG